MKMTETKLKVITVSVLSVVAMTAGYISAKSDESIIFAKELDLKYASSYGESSMSVVDDSTESSESESSSEIDSSSDLDSSEVSDDSSISDSSEVESIDELSEDSSGDSQTNYSVISYTDTEFDMLCSVVEAEAGDYSYDQRVLVADTVINRVLSGQYPNSIYEVLTTPGQYDSVNNYYYPWRYPSDDTISSVESALNGYDPSYGATSYYNPSVVTDWSTVNWFESQTLTTEYCGVRFFK